MRQRYAASGRFEAGGLLHLATITLDVLAMAVSGGGCGRDQPRTRPRRPATRRRTAPAATRRPDLRRDCRRRQPEGIRPWPALRAPRAEPTRATGWPTRCTDPGPPRTRCRSADRTQSRRSVQRQRIGRRPPPANVEPSTSDQETALKRANEETFWRIGIKQQQLPYTADRQNRSKHTDVQKTNKRTRILLLIAIQYKQVLVVNWIRIKNIIIGVFIHKHVFCLPVCKADSMTHLMNNNICLGAAS